MTVHLEAVPDRAARRAVTAVFMANGLALASWVARIPHVQAETGVSESALGLLILGLAAGVVVALTVAGRLAVRLGSRPVMLVGGGITAATLPAIAMAPTTSVLAVTLVVFGVGLSTMDLGMNTHGVGVERTYAHSIMVSFHAAWSVGALLGALLASLLLALGVGVVPHLLLAGVLVAVTSAAAAPWLRVRDRAAPSTAAPRFSLPRGTLLPVALIAFAAAIGEGTGGDWSGVFLRDVVAVAPERVAWGYVAITAAMTVVRLVGDRLARRFGAPTVIRAGGAIAAVGFLVVALVPVLGVSLIGFTMVGAGVGAIVPLSFSAAAQIARTPGEGVAATATLAYSAFLIGPPVVGALAETFDLRVPFVGVGLLVLAMTMRADTATKA